MGDYLRDTMLRQDLLDSIHQRAGEARAEKQTLDNKRIAKRVELEDDSRKLNALKEIAARYPEASKYESRQLLSSDTDGSRYLSPVMQLVGVESNIADIRNDLVSLERDVAQNDLRLEFYAAAEMLNASLKSGRELFDEFKRLRVVAFNEVHLDDDRVREVVNGIDLLAETLQTKHLANTRFISGPSLPDHRTGLPIALLAFFAVLLGGIVAGLAVMALRWVQTKKARTGLAGGIAEPGVTI